MSNRERSASPLMTCGTIFFAGVIGASIVIASTNSTLDRHNNEYFQGVTLTSGTERCYYGHRRIVEEDRWTLIFECRRLEEVINHEEDIIIGQ